MTDETTETEIDAEPLVGDSVADRTLAYCRLLKMIHDGLADDLRTEAFLMLKAVRRSFKTIPSAESATDIRKAD